MNAEAAPPPSTKVTDLLGVLQDHIHHVHVRVTAAVGIAAVFFTQIPLGKLRHQPEWARPCSVAGLVLLLCSAALYYQYTQQLNKLRLKIVAEGLEANHQGSAEKWRKWMTTTGKGPLWRHPFQASRLDWNSSSIWFYRIGQALLLLGTTLVAVVLARLILRG